jgi:hypothetical protein
VEPGGREKSVERPKTVLLEDMADAQINRSALSWIFLCVCVCVCACACS